MVVIPLNRLIGLPTSLFKSFFGRMGRNEAVTAAANQIGATCLLQRLAPFKVVFRLEKLH
jgi:hypothetical protein